MINSELQMYGAGDPCIIKRRCDRTETAFHHRDQVKFILQRSTVCYGIFDFFADLFGFGAETPDYGAVAAASEYAADLQYQATKEGRELQEKIYKENKEMIKPWLDMSKWALDKLKTGMKDGTFEQPQWMGEEQFAKTFKESPGYKFRQSEGAKAMSRAAGASGKGAGGGAHMKAAARYSGNLASQEYGQAYGRALTDYNTDLENKRYGYNRLASIAQIGQVGPTTAVGLNQQHGQAQTNLAIQGANALGAGAINAANAGVQGTMAGNAASQQNFNNIMRLLM